jgi:hypothetical protein
MLDYFLLSAQERSGKRRVPAMEPSNNSTNVRVRTATFFSSLRVKFYVIAGGGGEHQKAKAVGAVVKRV